MMRYGSTRGQSGHIESCEAIVRGIAPDGGLFVPQGELPKQPLRSAYAETMKALLACFFADIPEGTREAAVAASLARFAHPEIVPVHACGTDAAFLELFHGPTGAFKDVALTLLPHLMRAAAEKEQAGKVCVLAATSGDTGSAAMEGFANIPETTVLTLFPKVGTSEIQRRQMTCCTGENVTAFAIEGNFDDAQAAVKAAFANADLMAKAREAGMYITSANSINIGRLVPQIAYYLHTANRLKRPFDVVVPTGNFGNILAARFARCMGAPIERFVVASNTNRVVCDFIKEGIYDTQRPFQITNSPSMDILVSSNVERFLWMLADKDEAQVRAWQAQLKQSGRFELTAAARDTMVKTWRAGWATPEETEVAIREVWEKHRYLVDPHTAIGWKVAQELGLNNPVIAATATPWKFPKTVLHALTGRVIEDDFRAGEALAELTGETPRFLELETATARHNGVTSREGVPETIRSVFGF